MSLPPFMPLSNVIQGLSLSLAEPAQQGAVLTDAQFQLLNELPTLFGEDPVSSTMRRLMSGELATIAENGRALTPTLPNILSFVHMQLGASLDDLEHPAKERLSGDLRKEFGLGASGSTPPPRGVAALLAPGRPYDRLQVLDANNTPVVRLISDEFRRLAVPAMPRNFFVSGIPVSDPEDANLPRRLQRIFGRDVPLDLLFRMFSLEAVNARLPAEASPYEVSHLYFHKGEGGAVMQGILGTLAGDHAGNFTIIIPRRQEGRKWVADGRDFKVVAGHRQQGLSTALLKGFLVLLLHLGVDALEAVARESVPQDGRSNSRYYYAKVGFNPDRAVFKGVLEHFLAYMGGLGLLTNERVIEINDFEDIWQIADYEVDGKKVGKTFLSDVIHDPLTMHFQVRGNYPGWLRLVPRDALPPEWASMSEATRLLLGEHLARHPSIVAESLLSDARGGFYLADWVNNQVSPIAMVADFVGTDVWTRWEATVTPKMAAVADILSLVALQEGSALAHYFKKNLRTGQNLDAAVAAIRRSGYAIG